MKVYYSEDGSKITVRIEMSRQEKVLKGATPLCEFIYSPDTLVACGVCGTNIPLNEAGSCYNCKRYLCTKHEYAQGLCNSCANLSGVLDKE